MKKYKEIKSRNSVTKITGNKVEVKIKIPPSKCHPGSNVNFYSQGNPPYWTCAECGGVILIEKPVNTATIFE